MINGVVNKSTLEAINNYLSHPKNNLLLLGEQGIGKSFLAKEIARELLMVKDLTNQPYYLEINSSGDGIDVIREIYKFTSLKTIGSNDIRRVVFIDSLEYLGIPAQNAMLKILEEPPSDTIFILSASSISSIAPTIASRCLLININRPNKAELKVFYKDLNETDFNSAFSLSGGLPAIMDSLISKDNEQLSEAANLAKTLVTSLKANRLDYIDQMAKDKILAKNTILTISKIAEINIRSNRQAKKWQRILEECQNYLTLLNQNAQIKLLTLNFLLRI